MRLTNWRISCEGARGSRRATSQQYQARRLPPQERALASCMRWLGRPMLVIPTGWEEDVFQSVLEDTRDSEREWKGRVIPLGFDGIDGLPRDTQLLGESCLRPTSLGPQLPKAIVHRGL